MKEPFFFLILKGAWEGRPPILKEIQVLNLNNGRQLFVCELEIKPQGRGQGGGECSKSLENIFFSSKKTRWVLSRYLISHIKKKKKGANSNQCSSESPKLHMTKNFPPFRYHQNLLTSHQEKCDSDHQQPLLNSGFVLSYLSFYELVLGAKIEILMHADACIGSSIQRSRSRDRRNWQAAI